MFTRLFNLISGYFNLLIKGTEANNPEIAYENVINKTTESLLRARNAVAGIVAERSRIQSRVDKIQIELKQVNSDLDASLNTEDDELSALLLQKKDQLETQLAQQMSQLEQSVEQVEAAKADLLRMQGKIEELKRERDSNLARFHSSKARQRLQEQLSGLSTDADIKALDGVREAIDKSVAQVQLNDEMENTNLDNRLTKLRQSAGETQAQARVKALKAARQEQAAGANSKSM